MDTDSDNKAEGISILVAYFSLAGEQYGVGVIEEGNTAVIAKMIAEQTGADVFEIEAVKLTRKHTMDCWMFPGRKCQIMPVLKSLARWIIWRITILDLLRN